MKRALGLFHFNLQDVAGEPAATHRYCSQVVLPFLEIMASRPEFRTTFEMAGNGLEFLAENYPSALNLIRELIARNQLELVSSTYAPTLWVAFPRRDLEQSIRLNRKTLEKLGLPVSRIFFAQDGLFGPGLEFISDWFDVAVCRDDTLRMCTNSQIATPIYRLGKLTVIVGANHLLDELAAQVVRMVDEERPLNFSSFYEAHIQDAISNPSSHSAPEYIDGVLGGTEWHWYHFGRAHHFTTTVPPQHWDAFFFDSEWSAMTAGVFDTLLADGYRLSFISELAHDWKDERVEPLPRMVESSWNPKLNRGVYAWMGWQEHRWQTATGLLTLIWRARSALRRSEALLEGSPDHSRELEAMLEQIWKEQILAESSDPLDASALPCEVNFGRERGDRVLEMCAALAARVPRSVVLGHPVREAANHTATRFATPPTSTELVGADGGVEWLRLSESSYLCESRFRVDQRTSGIRFKRESDWITYCPSGSEDQPSTIDLQQFPHDEFYLPLANGLISLSENLHLIRDNCSVPVAARISKREPWITFAAEGSPEGRLFQWRFFLIRGELGKAAAMANEVNHI